MDFYNNQKGNDANINQLLYAQDDSQQPSMDGGAASQADYENVRFSQKANEFLLISNFCCL
jgi:hypothetical protein